MAVRTLVFLAIFLPLASSCTGRQRVPAIKLDHMYELYRSSENWDLEFWLNEQPVLIGFNASCEWLDVTPHVINGSNHARLRAKYVPSVSHIPASATDCCELTLSKVSYPGGERTPLFKAMVTAQDQTVWEQDAMFSASVPISWTWQQADDLGSLGDRDKDDVMKVLHRLASVLQTREPRAIYDECSNWWAGDVRPIMYWDSTSLEQKLADQKAYAQDVTNWTVTVESKSHIRFTAGTKLLCLTVPRITEEDTLVMAHIVPTSAPVIRAGPPPSTPLDGSNAIYGYYLSPLFLVKKGGSWRILYWD